MRRSGVYLLLLTFGRTTYKPYYLAGLISVHTQISNLERHKTAHFVEGTRLA